MKERYKMLLSAPLWVPAAVVGCAANAVFGHKSFKYHWNDLVDIIKWAWRN